MTPEQRKADLIIDGWIPVQYTRTQGDVWRGMYKEGVGLVYADCSPLYDNHPTHFVRNWPYFDVKMLAQLRCRWSDIMGVLDILVARMEEEKL